MYNHGFDVLDASYRFFDSEFPSSKLNDDNLELLKNIIIDYENELYDRLISINVNSEHIQR